MVSGTDELPNLRTHYQVPTASSNRMVGGSCIPYCLGEGWAANILEKFRECLAILAIQSS